MTASSFDWNDELVPETEEEVYRALLRALRRKQGFGLFFVQCTPDQGQKVVGDLRRDLLQQKIQELHLQGEVVTLYDQIAELWREQPFDVLVIDGLQASLYAYEDTKRFSGWSSSDIYHYSWKDVPQILNHLNQQREHLRNDFPARFVFLMPSFVVDYFIQRAADFLDWRSGLFRFPPNPAQVAQDVDQFVVNGDLTVYRTLTSEERVEKILNLKAALRQIEDLHHDLPASKSPNREHQNLSSTLLSCDTSDLAQQQYELLSELGMLFAAERDYENALISYDKALEFKSDDHKAWHYRGNALYASGRKEDAVRSYDKAIELKPDNHKTWFNRGNGLSALGRKEDAVRSYDKAIELKPDYYKAWFNRGNALSDLGRKEDAVKSYDKALEFKPDDYLTWFGHGNALSDLGRKEDAVKSYDKALEFKPDNYIAWYCRGNALFDLGRKEDAVKSYDKALEFKSDDHLAWSNRGAALSDLGRNEDAVKSYDKALEFKSDDHLAWSNRGAALSDLGRNEDAVKSYDKALEFKSDWYPAWNNCGNAKMRLGQFDAAHESFDQAILLKPDEARPHYNKARCYSLQKQIDLAISTLQYAITLDSKCQKWAKTHPDFDFVRQDDRFQALVGKRSWIGAIASYFKALFQREI